MEIDRRALKQQARETMRLTNPSFRLVTLVYLLMTTGVSVALSRIAIWTGSETVSIFFNLLYMLYGTVAQFGFCLWSLWTYQQLDPGLGALTQGFSVAGRVILMNLGITLRTILWYLCGALFLIFPTVLLLFLLPVHLVWAAWLFFVVGLLTVIYAISLRYSLAPYLLADYPDDGSEAAIRRSVGLMQGWKWELFRLDLTFVGWMLLAFAIQVAVYVVALVQAGFVETVTQTISQVNITPEVLIALREEGTAILNRPLPTLLAQLLPLPIILWYIPYRAVSYAGFYDARTHLQQSASPL